MTSGTRYTATGFCFLAVLAVGISTAFTEAVPQEARQVAQSYLDEKWKGNVARSPEVYNVVGIDVSRGVLAEPIFEYVLRDSAIAKYLSSGDADPRPYVILRRYTFPIFVGGTYAGSIMVQRNRDEDGAKFDKHGGEYIVLAAIAKGKGVTQRLLDLRGASPAGSEIGWVEFAGGGAESRFLVQSATGSLLSAPLGEDLVPMSEDARRIKAGLRSRQGAQKQLQRGED